MLLDKIKRFARYYFDVGVAHEEQRRAEEPRIKHGPPGIRQVGYREYVGGKWEEIGKLQFDFMLAIGLKPHHFLLDIGCGSLRGGVRFIPYLDVGHYMGIDKEGDLIDAGITSELGYQVYEAKKPQLVASDRFEFDKFTARPDFALAQSLFTHLPEGIIETCFRNLRESVARNGVFCATFHISRKKRRNASKAHDHRAFVYTKKQVLRFGSNNGWEPHYIGNWNHPRGQVMVRYDPR